MNKYKDVRFEVSDKVEAAVTFTRFKETDDYPTFKLEFMTENGVVLLNSFSHDEQRQIIENTNDLIEKFVEINGLDMIQELS